MNRKLILPQAWIVLVGLTATLAGCGGPVAAPESFGNYNAKDGSFSCKSPKGWETTGGGRGGLYSAKFVQGSAAVKIVADFAGSVLGDIAKNAGPGLDVPGLDLSGEEVEDFSAVAQVHQMNTEKLAEELSELKLEPAEKVDTKLGEGRMSEFTGSRSFGGNIRGYMATFLSSDRRVTITCRCSDDSWEALKPAFREVVESLDRGKPEV